MHKKIIMIACVTIIGSLLVFNIILDSNNNKVNSYLEEGSTKTQSIWEINKFTTEINKMAQAQKLYILTGKEEYKNDFEKYFADLSTELNLLEKNGSISQKEYKDLQTSMNNFNMTNNNIDTSTEKSKISQETEQLILKQNNSQLELLSKFDTTVDNAKKVIDNNHASAISNTDMQTNGVKVISTIITGFSSYVMYFIKKGTKSESVTKLIDCIEDVANDKNKVKDDESKTNEGNNNKTKEVNKDITNISYIKENISRYDELLKIMKVINMENENAKESIELCTKIILQIDNNLYRLKIELRTCNELSKETLEILQKQLTELRIEFKSLPLYNQITKDIYNTMIKEDKNNTNI